jgi:hypothetical protein
MNRRIPRKAHFMARLLANWETRYRVASMVEKHAIREIKFGRVLTFAGLLAVPLIGPD